MSLWTSRSRSWCLLMLGWLTLAGGLPVPAKAATNIFFTQFEAVQGYDTNLDLVGQNGWLGQGSGGNGIVSDYFPGLGQQAYIGFLAPNPGDDYLIIWHPLNLLPVLSNMPIVKFSVVMAIADSLNGQYDDFQWTAYNVQTNSLFTIDFDNYSTNIWYALGTNFFPTGVSFSPNTTYTLRVTMDFSQNRWSATLDGSALVTNQPIAATGVPLNLGEIDAAWAVYNTNAPGDNYMLFDNYQVTAESLAPPPAMLQTFGRTGNGLFLLRLLGASGYSYAVDATTDLVHWTPLKTNVVTGGYFDLIDTTAPAFSKRFYRGRLVP